MEFSEVCDEIRRSADGAGDFHSPAFRRTIRVGDGRAVLQTALLDLLALVTLVTFKMMIELEANA